MRSTSLASPLLVSPLGRSPLLASLLASLIAAAFSAGCPGFGNETGGEDGEEYPERPVFADVKPVLDTYCNECHSAPPTQGAPVYLRLDVCEGEAGVSGARAQVERIVGRMVQHDIGPMPPADYPLQPGQAEDDLLLRWRDLGAPCTPAELPPVESSPDAAPQAALQSEASP